MPEVERLTVAVPAELAATVRAAVDSGDYASTGDVMRAALQDWQTKRAARLEASASLKADIEIGLADVAAGRTRPFDVARIVEQGRARLADR